MTARTATAAGNVQYVLWGVHETGTTSLELTIATWAGSLSSIPHRPATPSVRPPIHLQSQPLGLVRGEFAFRHGRTRLCMRRPRGGLRAPSD